MANGETGLEISQVYYKGDMVNKVVKHSGGGEGVGEGVGEGGKQSNKV